MPEKLPFLQYSLRSRLLFLGGATFLLCACVILLFSPLLNITLDGLLDRSIKTMKEEKEVEATTITRLMVLEFSQLKDLLTVAPEVDKDIDRYIKNLLWQKVTFNEIIEGMELIRTPGDAQGQYLTYLFYRREAPELKPMAGPQKSLKKFSGLEKELLDSINSSQSVDKNLVGSVNRGPKKEGEMLLRYMPVHVLLPDEGAIYWGVAKIGIDTSGMSQMLLFQSVEQDRVRKAIWLEIILSLSVAGLIAMGLIYLWVRNLTEPLKNLSSVAGDLQTAQPRDFDLWLDNLKRVDPRGQAEVADLQHSLVRLGGAIPRIGRRLIAEEGQACWGRVVARALPTLLALSDQMQAPKGGLEAGILERLHTAFADWHRLSPSAETGWQAVDLTPILTSAWRLVTLGLPEKVKLVQEVETLPPVWGSPAALKQAVLYLLEYAGDGVGPEGELFFRASAVSPAWVQVSLQFSGPQVSPEAGRQLLEPFKGFGEIQGSLGPALAAAIAAQHGGSLKVQPQPRGGLTFQLKLPTATAPHESR